MVFRIVLVFEGFSFSLFQEVPQAKPWGRDFQSCRCCAAVEGSLAFVAKDEAGCRQHNALCIVSQRVKLPSKRAYYDLSRKRCLQGITSHMSHVPHPDPKADK